MCPRTFFSEQWIFKNMSMETFQKIGGYFPLTKWVYLQGWGEPLENENLIEMVRLAKRANCLTGFTDNGVNLTDDISRELLSEGIDLVVISMGGATKESHEMLRVGSDFGRILDNVKKLTELKKHLNINTPTVKLSQIMTKFNIGYLPGMIPLAIELGVDEVMVTNIDYLAGERCNFLRTFYHESPSPAFQDSIDEMHRLGKEMGMTVRSYPLKAEEVLVCEANPPQNVFFSVDGSVAPCIYLRIPKKGDIIRIFQNKEYHVPQTFFGNINDEDFLQIWNKESYKRFRKIFEERRKAEFNMAKALEAIDSMSFSKFKEQIDKRPPPFPDVCQTCYKAYGI
ncbi:MAG: SPASM domain-containing protein [Deltaproteobacteria bacterium]|nr:SPASM domain-containing protein [Deltaproteobacteria bacterium]MBW2306928.1 SPASM domain-containing protein [Deltaproteobacteria bacterium]